MLWSQILNQVTFVLIILAVSLLVAQKGVRTYISNVMVKNDIKISSEGWLTLNE